MFEWIPLCDDESRLRSGPAEASGVIGECGEVTLQQWG